MKIWNILSFVEYGAVAERLIGRMILRLRRCPLSSTLYLSSAVFYGIAFYFALEQSIILLSNLAKLEIMMLIGLPTTLAVLAILVGSCCRLDSKDRL